MSTLELFLADETRTMALGAALAGVVKPGDVIALRGGLGAGKTTLARGFMQALCGPDTETPSPTYTLVQTYPTPAFLIWHFDLYRVETPYEVDELGWEDTQDGVALVEWPDHAGRRLPDWRLDLTLDSFDAGRRAALEPRGEDWQARLDGFRI
ncbi:MAG: tRNA (adenosine(37)-N6)-threonylcarbamoyltransferase complex ATPase subunit type 1 TsaE [Pseudomonadota bacterium]